MKISKTKVDVVRGSNENITKQLMFQDERNVKRGRHHETVLEKVVKQQNNEFGNWKR